MDCYTFTYTEWSIYSDGQPVSRTVRYKTKIGLEDYHKFPTLPDTLFGIQANCFDECPSGSSDFCQIEYATKNETGLVFPIFVNMSEDTTFRLENVSTHDCDKDVKIQTTDDAVAYEGQSPCFNWEVNAAAFKEAFAKWKEPACYTFTYDNVVQTVRNGTELRANGDIYLPFQSLTDIWHYVDEQCVRNCPTYGAHNCQIEYSSNGESGLLYPSVLSIDYVADVGGDEVTYVINVSPCKDRKAEVCVNFEQVQND